MATNKVYFNPPQQVTMYTGAHTTIFLGGRRLGKTHGVQLHLLREIFNKCHDLQVRLFSHPINVV